MRSVARTITTYILAGWILVCVYKDFRIVFYHLEHRAHVDLFALKISTHFQRYLGQYFLPSPFTDDISDIFDRLRFLFSQSTFQHGIPWNPKWLFKKFAAVEAHFLFFALSSKHVETMHSGMSVPWKYYTEEILCPGNSPLLHLFISPLPKSLTTTDLFLILAVFCLFHNVTLLESQNM